MEYPVIIYGGSLVLLVLALAIVLLVLISQRKIIETKRENQRAIIQSTIDAQERERGNISKNLHDDIGARLASVQLNLASRTADSVQQQIDELTDISQRLRQISHDLSPTVLKRFGLVQALQSLCDDFSHPGEEIQYVYRCEQGIRLRENSELSVYRIVQELLNNSIKHSDAKLIQLDIICKVGKMQVIFKDNGKGFSFNQKLDSSKGLGIGNIMARIEALGAKWNQVGCENGFCIEIVIDIEKNK